MQRSLLVNKTPFFYGWMILVAGTAGVIMTSPGQTYAISIFTEHFIQDLNVSRSLISTLYALGTLTGSLALPLIGREIDHRGSRIMVVAIAGIFGLACIYMANVRSALMLLLGFVAIRMFGQGGLTLVSQNVINQWWVNRRGTVMGLSGLFASLLGLGMFPNLISWLIPLYGWRATYTLLGVSLLLGMVPLGYLFFRERPEAYGLQPDGDDVLDEQNVQTHKRRFEDNWTRTEALRSPAFWIIAAGAGTIAMMSTGLFFHMVSIFADNNLSQTVAASVYLPIAATMALVALSSGALVDRIPLHYALSASLLLMALLMLMARYLSNVPLAIFFGVVLGTTMGLFRTVISIAWAHYFGRQHLGSISGAGATILIVGSSLGPIPLGVARDMLGNYNLALTLLAIVPFVLAIVSLFLPRLMKRHHR